MRDCDGAPEDYVLDVEKRRVRPDWLAVAVAVLSMLTTLGSWAWWGGKLEQRVTTNEQNMVKQEQRISELARENAAQANSIATTSAQYADIIRRLDGIERKLDRER